MKKIIIKTSSLKPDDFGVPETIVSWLEEIEGCFERLFSAEFGIVGRVHSKTVNGRVSDLIYIKVQVIV